MGGGGTSGGFLSGGGLSRGRAEGDFALVLLKDKI